MATMSRPEWQRMVDTIIEREPLTPGRGKVIVARDPTSEVLSEEANLVRAEKYKEMPQTGTIVALGERRENPMGTPVDFVFDVGHRVIVNQLCGKRLLWGGLDMAVIDEDEIVARLNPAL